MDPSSLIFLAIIAIWAAYLVGHWIRRRDQLATARSIDRFSEAMRVLERRAPTRPVSGTRPTARSYVVAPVRVPAPSTDRTSRSRSSSADVRVPGSRTSAPAAAWQGASARATSVGATVAAAGPASARSRITREAARRRARLVLGLVVATVLAWGLVAATALVWWPAAVTTVVLAAVLVQLRRTARPAPSPQRRSARRRSEQRRPARSAARRPAGRTSSRRRGLASRVPAPARRPRHHEDARTVLDKVDAARRSQAHPVANPAVIAGTVLADVDPDLPTSEPARHEAGGTLHASAADSGWQPVPVPPPTYTLKGKARPVVRRPAPDAAKWGEVQADAADAPPADRTPDGARPATGAQADVRSTPEPSEPAAPAFDLDEILERRIAAGG